MLLKIFQAVLVTFLVIFTAAGAIFLLSGIVTNVFAFAGTGGITAFSGGLSVGVLEIVLIIGVLLGVAVVFLVARRHRLK
jgi:hypothetical protein